MSELRPVDSDAPVVHRGAPGDELILPIIAWVFMFGGWSLVGLVIALINRRHEAPHVRTSYAYLIRTVWKGALGFLATIVVLTVSAALTKDGELSWAGLLGPVAVLAFGVWYYARCIKAFVLLVRSKPVANPKAWLI